MFFGWIAIIILFILYFGQNARITKLEQGSPKTTTTSTPTISHTKEPEKPESKTPAREIHTPGWLTTNWPMKIGAGLLLIALIWFVSYAFSNNWIGPVGRVALGLIASLGVFGFGASLLKKRFTPAQVLIALGGLGVFATMYSGFLFYQFFGPVLVLVATLIVVATVGVIATNYNAPSLATTTLVGGALVPMLLTTYFADSVLLLSYLSLLSFGALIAGAKRGWSSLPVISLVITMIYSFSFFYNIPDSAVWLFMAIFGLLHYSGSLMTATISRRVSQSDLLVAGGSIALFVFWVLEFVPTDLRSWVIGIGGLIPVIATFLLWKSSLPKSMAYVQLFGAVLALATITTIETSGSLFTILTVIESAGLVLLARFVLNDEKLARGLSYLYILPVILGITHFAVTARIFTGSNQAHFWALGVTFIGAALLAYIFRAQSSPSSENRTNAGLFYVFTGVLGGGFAWRALEQMFAVDTAHVIALILFALIGIAFLYLGIGSHEKEFERAGTVILVAVLLRLFLVELWLMSIGGRITVFAIVGALLLSTAFFRKSVRSGE